MLSPDLVLLLALLDCLARMVRTIRQPLYHQQTFITQLLRCLIAGTLMMSAAAVAIGAVLEPWQLYLANAVLAFGWASMSLPDDHHDQPVVRSQAQHCAHS